MMFNFPYFSMPYSNRYSRYGYKYPYYSYKNMNRPNTNNYVNNKNDNCSNNYKKDDSFTESNDSPLFQLFGINLYFDDILLICLIWFLYNEGVKDQELFIALILLLLS